MTKVEKSKKKDRGARRGRHSSSNKKHKGEKLTEFLDSNQNGGIFTPVHIYADFYLFMYNGCLGSPKNFDIKHVIF